MRTDFCPEKIISTALDGSCELVWTDQEHLVQENPIFINVKPFVNCHTNEDSKTSIILSVQNAHCMELLCRNGVDVQAANEFGANSMMMALSQENFQLFHTLSGPLCASRLDSVDLEGLTVLDYSVRSGNLEVIQELLRKGAKSGPKVNG